MTAHDPEAIASLLHAEQVRPEPPGAIAACLSFGHRALLKIKHVPEQLFDVTIFPIMMTVMFTYLFGGALAGSVEEYVQFLIPGVLAQTIVMITMYTGLTINKDISKGVFDRFRTLPVWRPAPLVGALIGDLFRYSIAGIIVLALGFVMGFRPAGGPTGVVAGLALLLVFAFSLSWIWTAIALLLRSEQAVMGVSMMVITPLVFASNIFVDPATMPGWLQAFVGVNPVSMLVTSMRELMGGLGGASMGPVLIWCAVLVAVFGPLTMVIYNRKS